MPRLPELIADRRNELGLSFSELERLTSIPKATLAWLTQQGDRTFTVDTDRIPALANGLKLPIADVQLAAIESAGLMPVSLESSSRAHMLSRDLEGLSDADWRLVRSLVRRLTGGA